VNLEKPWRAIRKAAVLPNVRLHDLRHAFASIGAAGGDSLLVIGKLLGHSQVATTERYAHFALDPIKAAAAFIAGRIASALEGANGNGEGVPLAHAVVRTNDHAHGPQGEHVNPGIGDEKGHNPGCTRV
jgi:hypothetical protein